MKLGLKPGNMKFCQIKRKNIKLAVLFVFISLFFGLFNNIKEAKANNILGGTGKLTCKNFPKETQDLINTTSDIGALAKAINYSSSATA